MTANKGGDCTSLVIVVKLGVVHPAAPLLSWRASLMQWLRPADSILEMAGAQLGGYIESTKAAGVGRAGFQKVLTTSRKVLANSVFQ